MAHFAVWIVTVLKSLGSSEQSMTLMPVLLPGVEGTAGAGIRGWSGIALGGRGRLAEPPGVRGFGLDMLAVCRSMLLRRVYSMQVPTGVGWYMQVEMQVEGPLALVGQANEWARAKG